MRVEPDDIFTCRIPQDVRDRVCVPVRLRFTGRAGDDGDCRERKRAQRRETKPNAQRSQ
jgi:hypothetical protein